MMATEKRLIDANALVIEELLVMDRDYINEFASGVRKVMNAIRRLPTVDAVEVKHGQWEEHDRSGINIKGFMVCSVCNVMIPTADNDYYCLPRLNYCPNCGADMRERKDNG